eukprot:NODE_710_length_4537_cov_0.398828.p5 type:complete len:136 gc:universal NODE_710_length_4537_cov_0.398828:804-1211(+)
MSFGTDISECPDTEIEGFDRVEKAIDLLIEKGAVIVKAAGNEHVDSYKADRINRIPGVIVVGAVNEDGSVAIYSNFGEAVDIFAPGSVHKFKRLFPSFYRMTPNYIEGTSFAAPYVTGAIALRMGEGDPNHANHC